MTSLVEIEKAYRAAKNRLLLLDYDGTLAPLAPTPPEAAPTPELLDLLKRLTDDSRNSVVIISGRKRDELDDWLGGLPLTFTAEHGLAWRENEQKWQYLEVDISWKPESRRLMQEIADAVPGSFIEEKTASLAWHWRPAKNPEAVPEALAGLINRLSPLANSAGLSLVRGKKVLELRPTHVHKGLGAAYWLAKQNWDFILAAGDEPTDEDLFAAMPESALTIKIGSGKTKAASRISSQKKFCEFLASLAQP